MVDGALGLEVLKFAERLSFDAPLRHAALRAGGLHLIGRSRLVGEVNLLRPLLLEGLKLLIGRSRLVGEANLLRPLLLRGLTPMNDPTADGWNGLQEQQPPLLRSPLH